MAHTKLQFKYVLIGYVFVLSAFFCACNSSYIFYIPFKKEFVLIANFNGCVSLTTVCLHL